MEPIFNNIGCKCGLQAWCNFLAINGNSIAKQSLPGGQYKWGKVPPVANSVTLTV